MKLFRSGKVPIVVGGTGLYIDSLVYGTEFYDVEDDLDYRAQLEKEADENGLALLYERAKEIDPKAIKKISPNDKKRILRVLEIYHNTGKTKSELDTESRKKGVKYDFIVFVLQMDREKLYNKINLRVDQMIENGLIEEVESIRDKYSHFPTAMQGIGYKEVVEYLENKLSRNEMIEKIKQETRRYAKRQITWFKKDKTRIFLDVERPNNIDIIVEEYGEKEK